MTYLSSKLKSLREEKGISQYKLASEINIKRSAYGNYETGMSNPEYDMLNKLANYYKIDIRELLEDNAELEKKLNIEKESEELLNNIKEYYYKRYRKVPSLTFIKKIVKFLLDK